MVQNDLSPSCSNPSLSAHKLNSLPPAASARVRRRVRRGGCPEGQGETTYGFVKDGVARSLRRRRRQMRPQARYPNGAYRTLPPDTAARSPWPDRRSRAFLRSRTRIAHHLPRPVRRQPHLSACRAHLRLAIPRRALPVEPPQMPALATRARRDIELLFRHQSWRCGSRGSCRRRPARSRTDRGWRSAAGPSMSARARTSAPQSGHVAGSGNRTSTANCARQPRHAPATVSRRAGFTAGRCAPQ